MGGVFLDEGNQTFKISVSFIFNWIALFSIGPEFKGGITFNFNGWNFVGGRINLSDDNIWVVSNFVSEFFIDGSKLFAVTTPGGIEFNQDILVTVKYDFIEVFSNNGSDSVTVGFRNILALKIFA